ncbi:hypothetical protein Acr_24g0012160 [Actinidia rufa]|uniref:NAD(P)-binding Rossmann-fold superfamily protein n=1 Tax=Actinidia rufa TaxID=165716 RepID=A0A7J0GW65_9ERIC|nr:hypothetical protein Acr_24g0012160 [Actinidia rufa]
MAKVERSCRDSRWTLTGMTALGLIGSNCEDFRHAVVEELAELGATVYTCSRNEAELNRCLQEWAAKGFTVTGREERKSRINTHDGSMATQIAPPFARLTGNGLAANTRTMKPTAGADFGKRPSNDEVRRPEI